MPIQIKICGLTNREDIELIAAQGADFGGVLIEITQSARSQSVDTAKAFFSASPLPLVAVTLDKNLEDNIRIVYGLSPAALQLHGYELPEMVRSLKEHVSCEIWKVLHLPAKESLESVDLEPLYAQIQKYEAAGVDRFVIDASITVQGEKHLGGTGKTVDWNIVKQIQEVIRTPIILAGGISPQNIGDALRTFHPYGIDLSSGVEKAKGKKDPALVKQLIGIVREME